ncbi:MAG: ankyrin repeat domain-containing protein [Alphaproteobacteria bacterium]
MNESNLFEMLDKNGKKYSKPLNEIGANDRDGEDKTGLILSVIRGDIDSAKIFLEKGTDVNAVDRYGCTALHYAAMRNHKDVLELLLENNANVEIKGGINSETAIHIAAARGNLEGVRMLLQYKASIESTNMYKQTPLHIAAKHGQIKVVEILLNEKAVMDAKDYHGSAPIDEAARFSHYGVVGKFLSLGQTVSDKMKSYIKNCHSKEELEKLESFINEFPSNSSQSNDLNSKATKEEEIFEKLNLKQKESNGQFR